MGLKTQSIQVLYYDGVHNQAQQAQLIAHPDGVEVHYADQKKLYLSEDLTYIGAVGKILPSLELPDDARVEFLNHDVPDWLVLKNKRLLHFFHHIENSWRWIIVSFFAMIIVVFSTYKWGIPAASYHIAMQLPQKTLYSVGEQAEAMVIEMTEKSELPLQRQQHIQALYTQNVKTNHPAKIVFRKGGDQLSANALAIPNDTIILTDELIALAKNDQELLGVLSHEQGHLDERHSLQQALASLGMSILYVSITGDASDLLSGLPLAIAVSNYSQKFELQADQRAITELKRLNISPKYMADFLKRLTEESGEDIHSSDFLESHPSTARRIAQIEAQTP